MTGESEDHDLRILAESYMVLHEPQAFDAMLAAWDAKLSALGYGNTPLDESTPLLREYSMLRGLLRKLRAPEPIDSITRTVHRVHEPAMVLTRSLRIVAVNEAGKTAFGADTGKSATLDWLDPEQAAILRDMLRRLTDGKLTNSFYRIITTLAPGGGRGYAELFPINDGGLSEKVMAVRLLNPEWNPKINSVLAEAFGLTDAEIDVARLLFLQVDVGRVADLRGVNIRTARAQLGRIYAKTETRSQVELVRLLAHISSRVNEQTEVGALTWSDPYRREKLLIRPGGLRLAYTWIGDENGAPALFLPGIVHGYLFHEVFEQTLKAAGVKLWVLTRPGAGNSDRDAERPPLDDYIDAIRHFCRQFDLRNLPAMGIHSINVALVRIAASDDNPFSEIITVGRFLSVTGEVYKKVPYMPRTMLWLVTHSPWAAEIVGMQGHRALVASGVDWYIERAYGDMPFDYEFTRDADISAMLRDACAYTFLRNHGPFMDDLKVRQVDVRPDLPNLKVDMNWLIGAVDVYSPDRKSGVFYDETELKRYESENPRLRIFRIEEAADLIGYQKPKALAEAICNAAQRSRSGA